MDFKPRFQLVFRIGILLFGCSTLLAQGKFAEGYIVNLEGDTIPGLVEQRNWSINPATVNFKKSKDATAEEFAAGSIQMFATDKQQYFSGAVEVEVSPFKEEQLTRKSAFDIITETVFLKSLRSAPKQLLVYRNQDKKDNYYVPGDEGFVLLRYKKYNVLSDDQLVVRQNDTFRGQLQDYLSDCPGMDEHIDFTEYNKGSLLRLFSKYDDCQEEIDYYAENDYEDFEGNDKSDFGVVVGATNTQLKFRGSFNPELVDTDYDSSLDPTIGVFYTLNFPSKKKRWSVYNELLVTNYNITGNHNNFISENEFTTALIELGFTQLKLVNMARFKVLKGNLSVHLHAGISNATVIREKNYQFSTRRLFTDLKEEEGPALDVIRSLEQGLIFGAGIGYNRLHLDFRLEKSTGMSDYPSLGSDVNRLYLSLGYKLN